MFRSSARSLRLWWEDFSADILGADLPPTVYAEELTEPGHRFDATDRALAPWRTEVDDGAHDAAPAPAALTSAAGAVGGAPALVVEPRWSEHPHREPLRSRRVRRDGSVPVVEGQCVSPLPLPARHITTSPARDIATTSRDSAATARAVS